ncbi:hypothetical protein DFP72DRAFT_325105 [Ephemerocybe angulata]|uniref:Aminopeptidase N-like N-terminal domain-containing protein n=1 Tax=Ephemerocybe angulata TaxID=980116 RepID=A0A8H6IJB7_9AGAR|nr:hypothetical protein DFP72DRAFT_325105 [Tulosesus angulatus]
MALQKKMENTDQHRLPTNVKPFHYDLLMKTDLEALTFQGVVKISFDVVQETSSITLNTSNLTLDKVYAQHSFYNLTFAD